MKNRKQNEPSPYLSGKCFCGSDSNGNSISNNRNSCSRDEDVQSYISANSHNFAYDDIAFSQFDSCEEDETDNFTMHQGCQSVMAIDQGIILTCTRRVVQPLAGRDLADGTRLSRFRTSFLLEPTWLCDLAR